MALEIQVFLDLHSNFTKRFKIPYLLAFNGRVNRNFVKKRSR